MLPLLIQVSKRKACLEAQYPWQPSQRQRYSDLHAEDNIIIVSRCTLFYSESAESIMWLAERREIAHQYP